MSLEIYVQPNKQHHNVEIHAKPPREWATRGPSFSNAHFLFWRTRLIWPAPFTSINCKNKFIEKQWNKPPQRLSWLKGLLSSLVGWHWDKPGRRQDLKSLRPIANCLRSKYFIIIITPIANLEMTIWNDKVLLKCLKNKNHNGEVVGRNLYFV